MITLSLHNLTRIECGKIVAMTRDNGEIFHYRNITLTERTSGGELLEHCISLFSSDVHGLLIADPEVESITCSEVERRKLPRLAA